MLLGLFLLALAADADADLVVFIMPPLLLLLFFTFLLPAAPSAGLRLADPSPPPVPPPPARAVLGELAQLPIGRRFGALGPPPGVVLPLVVLVEVLDALGTYHLDHLHHVAVVEGLEDLDLADDGGGHAVVTGVGDADLFQGDLLARSEALGAVHLAVGALPDLLDAAVRGDGVGHLPPSVQFVPFGDVLGLLPGGKGERGGGGGGIRRFFL